MDVSHYNVFALLSIVVVAWIAKHIVTSLKHPLNKVPGPWYSKFTHLPLKFAVVTGRRIHYIHHLHGIYGPSVRIAPNEVAVNDPKDFKEIHGIGSKFEKHSWYSDATVMERPILFTMSDVKSHSARRRLFGAGFSKSNIRTNWESTIKERIVLAVSKIREEATKTGTADILKWWTLMASDVSSHLLFGSSFHTLEQGEENEFIRTLTKALKGNGIGAELPLVRTLGRMLPFQGTKELFRTNDFLIDYAKIAVRNMKASQASKNIFAHIQATAEKGETLDDIDVQTEALGLFVAGTDTTAISLTYLIWAILSRSELRRQIEEELETLPDDCQDADIEKLSLINAAIKETMRLYGAAPGALPRVVPAGGRDMGGYFIPQGSTVTTHAYSAHRDPSLFPDPYEFCPSRWLPDSKDALSEEAKTMFAPFGAGARGCLGSHIAYSELRLASAEFFRNVRGARLAPSVTPESMEMENYFLIQPRGHKCEIVLQ